MQLHGAWPDAMREAQRACERLSQTAGGPGSARPSTSRPSSTGCAASSRRAEEAYREASQWGREPQPGLALLRLAQGKIDAAAAAIRRVLDEAQDSVTRARLLGRVRRDHARRGRRPGGARRRRRAGRDRRSARGAAAARGGRPGHGRRPPRRGRRPGRAHRAARAWAAWQELEAPYEAARVRVLIGLACRALGDEDSAEMELDAARWVFRQLGAAPDWPGSRRCLAQGPPRHAGGLTAREVEVLRLVAAGKTNREIAAALVISDHTVRRHLQNIFTKLGVSSRAAATAFAFQHDLI